MIGIDMLVASLPGLQRTDLERWIGYDWVRPARDHGPGQEEPGNGQFP